jgi:cardiolipin synthase
MVECPFPNMNLPNTLTLVRMFLVPLLVVVLLTEFEGRQILGMRKEIVGAGIFAIASITDWLDGYLARRRRQVTWLGQMLDPIADKLLVAACLVMLVADGSIRSFSIWAAIVILTREILVSGLREFLAELRVSVPVTTLAKWKTTMQLVALGFLVVGDAGDAVLPAGMTVLIGLVMLWIAALLTFVTGWDYLRSGLRHLIEEDAG